MKILHLMLSCFYIDKGNYQENQIPRQNKNDGHDVMIVASTEVFTQNNILGLISPGHYLNEDGIPVIRLPYTKIINNFFSKKIRSYSNLYKIICEFQPDIIFFHGASAYAITTAVKFKRNNPQVKLYVDSHEDSNNSAKNFFSKQILHKLFYKPIIRWSLPYIDLIFYITIESKIFLKKVYGLPEDKLHFLPLGGVIPENEKRETIRERIRKELCVEKDQLLLIHSGKLDKNKRTHEIVTAFKQVKDQNLRLIIIGSMDDDVRTITMPLIDSDPRINYLGWMKSEILQNYLCAGDLYIQLGGQSVTMQNAVCSGCAAALYPYKSHKHLLNDSVFYIRNTEDLINVINIVLNDRNILEDKQKKSFEIAMDKLDYKKISSTIY